MSSFLRLVGIKGEHGIKETIKSINETIEMGDFSNYEFKAKTINVNTKIPQPVKLRYSEFMRLKLIASKLHEDPNWMPDNSFVAQSMPPGLHERYISKNKSHLICHASDHGYLIPVKFNHELLPKAYLTHCGSSVNLCNELKEIASRLKFDLGDYTPDLDFLFDQRIDEFEDGDPILSEKILILYLYNFCLASIKNELAISFG
jgi:hypothetical protein